MTLFKFQIAHTQGKAHKENVVFITLAVINCH